VLVTQAITAHHHPVDTPNALLFGRLYGTGFQIHAQDHALLPDAPSQAPLPKPTPLARDAPPLTAAVPYNPFSLDNIVAPTVVPLLDFEYDAARSLTGALRFQAGVELYLQDELARQVLLMRGYAGDQNSFLFDYDNSMLPVSFRVRGGFYDLRGLWVYSSGSSRYEQITDERWGFLWGALRLPLNLFYTASIIGETTRDLGVTTGARSGNYDFADPAYSRELLGGVLSYDGIDRRDPTFRERDINKRGYRQLTLAAYYGVERVHPRVAASDPTLKAGATPFFRAELAYTEFLPLPALARGFFDHSLQLDLSLGYISQIPQLLSVLRRRPALLAGRDGVQRFVGFAGYTSAGCAVKPQPTWAWRTAARSCATWAGAWGPCICRMCISNCSPPGATCGVTSQTASVRSHFTTALRTATTCSATWAWTFGSGTSSNKSRRMSGRRCAQSTGSCPSRVAPTVRAAKPASAQTARAGSSSTSSWEVGFELARVDPRLELRRLWLRPRRTAVWQLRSGAHDEHHGLRAVSAHAPLDRRAGHARRTDPLLLVRGDLRAADLGFEDLRRIAAQHGGFAMAFDRPREHVAALETRDGELSAQLADSDFTLQRLDDDALDATQARRYLASVSSTDYKISAYFGASDDTDRLPALTIESLGIAFESRLMPAQPELMPGDARFELTYKSDADYLEVELAQAITPRDPDASVKSVDGLVRTSIATGTHYIVPARLLSNVASQGCWSPERPIQARVRQIARRYQRQAGGDWAVIQQRTDGLELEPDSWTALLAGEIQPLGYCDAYE